MILLQAVSLGESTLLSKKNARRRHLNLFADSFEDNPAIDGRCTFALLVNQQRVDIHSLISG